MAIGLGVICQRKRKDQAHGEEWNIYQRVQSKAAPSCWSVRLQCWDVWELKHLTVSNRFIIGRVTSRMTQRKWRSFSSLRQQSASKTWPATHDIWSASLPSMQQGTAPGADPQRAGHTRLVCDHLRAQVWWLLVANGVGHAGGHCCVELAFSWVVMLCWLRGKDQKCSNVGRGAERWSWNRWSERPTPLQVDPGCNSGGLFGASAITSENLNLLAAPRNSWAVLWEKRDALCNPSCWSPTIRLSYMWLPRGAHEHWGCTLS